MYQGESYGASQGTTTGENKDPETSKAQEEGVVKPGPDEEVKEGENVHETAARDKGFAYKAVVTSTFCFNCGTKAEYFAVNYGKWEKYLCKTDLNKEKTLFDRGNPDSQSVQAAGIQEKNAQMEQQYKDLQAQSQKFGEDMAKPVE